MSFDESIVKEVMAAVRALRHDLAELPEVGPNVSRTAGKVAELLQRTTLAVRPRVGFPEESAMGVLADLRVKDAQRTIALLADMSAQNVRPRTSGPASAGGKRCSHVAGNDAHTAMLVGAALLLHRSHVQNNVRFIWQSGGENLSDGAHAMIRDRALDGVDEIYALHLWPGLEVGKLGLAEGPVLASLDRFTLYVRGPDVVRPWQHRKIDAIRIGAAIVQELESLNGAGVSTHPATGHLRCEVTHFNASRDDEGSSPGEVILEGEVRAFSEDERNDASQRLTDISRRCAERYHGTIRQKVRPRATVTVNHPMSALRARQRLLRELGQANVIPVDRTFFSSGLGVYFATVPGAVVALGGGGPPGDPSALLLSPGFEFDEQCLELGVRSLALLAST